jgi:hypothetical protein
MNGKEIISAIKFPASHKNGVIFDGGKQLLFRVNAKYGNLIAAAINSLQEKGESFPTWGEAISGITDSRFTTLPDRYKVGDGARIMYDRLYCMLQSATQPKPVTICNELGDKPKSAQEETNQDELWREAIKEANDFALSGKWKQQAGYIPFVAEYAEAKDEYLKTNYIIKRK